MSECRTKVGSRGSALFTVLMTIFVLSVILTVVMGSGTQRSFTSRVLSDGVRAKAIAEAGAAYAFNALSADFEQYTNAAAFPETSFGGGTYDVDIVTVDSGKILIKSTGVYNGTIEETILLEFTVREAGIRKRDALAVRGFCIRHCCRWGHGLVRHRPDCLWRWRRPCQRGIQDDR